VENPEKTSIESIVEQALQDRYFTPAMEAEVGRICDSAFELSVEEYMALDRLMGRLRQIVIKFWTWVILPPMHSTVYLPYMPPLSRAQITKEKGLWQI